MSGRGRAGRGALAALVALVALVAACQRPSPAQSQHDHACLVDWGHTSAAPLPLGDSLRLAVGRFVERKGCVAPLDVPVRWANADTAVAGVTAGGWVVGRAPGAFALRAIVPGRARGVARLDTLDAGGFVLPRDYRVRVLPESATVAVGDTVWFEARATTADGALLPRVPHHLLSAEQQGRRAPRRLGDPPPPPPPAPLVEGTGLRPTTGPRPVVALRPGATHVTGVVGAYRGIGPREGRAALRILDAATARP